MCREPAARTLWLSALRGEKLFTESKDREGKRHMAAYVLVDVDVIDRAAMQEYAKGVAATVAAYGGEYLVRNGKIETVEGGWAPKGLIVLKFESVARAKEWLNSPEYAPLKLIRHAATNSRMIIVEGV
jgi:uncharacterized protein (DUF1330 family)